MFSVCVVVDSIYDQVTRNTLKLWSKNSFKISIYRVKTQFKPNICLLTLSPSLQHQTINKTFLILSNALTM